jgi:hypothetical protein
MANVPALKKPLKVAPGNKMIVDLFIAAKRAQDLLNELVGAGFIDEEHGHYQETTETLADLTYAIEEVNKYNA